MRAVGIALRMTALIDNKAIRQPASLVFVEIDEIACGMRQASRVSAATAHGR